MAYKYSHKNIYIYFFFTQFSAFTKYFQLFAGVFMCRSTGDTAGEVVVEATCIFDRAFVALSDVE